MSQKPPESLSEKPTDDVSKKTVKDTSEKAAENASENKEVWRYFAEVSEILTWIHERAWPLGGGIVFISVLYLYHYIQTEKVPINILSPSVLAGYLPVVMVILVFLIAVISGLILAPTAVLLTPLNENGKTFMNAWINDVQKAERGNAKFRLLVRLFFILCGIAIMYGISFVIHTKLPAPAFTISIIILFLFSPFLLLFCLISTKRINIRWKDISFDFGYNCLMWAWIQLISVFFVFYVITMSFNDNLYIILGVFVVSLAGMALIQLFFAIFFIELKSSPRPVTISALIGVLLIILPAFIPSLSSTLISTILQSVASPGNQCRVMYWVPDSKGIAAILKDPAHPEKSVAMKILTQEDGQYLVRINEVVYFIPRTQVAGLGVCEK